MNESIFQNSDVETSLLSYNGISTHGWEDTDNALVDSTGAFLDGSVRAFSEQVATESAPLSANHGSAAAVGSSEPKRGFSSALAFESLAAALSLLLFVGLLTLNFKRQAGGAPPDLSSAKEPGAMIAGVKLSDNEGIAKATARLEKVKDLLPAASRLASAVNSAESEKLMAEVEQVLKKSAEVTTDKEEMEAVVTVALKALQKLQRIAIEGAAVIVQADSSLPDFSSLRPWEKKTPEAMSDLEQAVQQPTVRSFISLYKSFYANEVCLSQRFAEVAERISSQEKFENETQGERLLTTAIAVEALRNLSAWKRDFALAEGQLSKGVVCATKFLLLAERDSAMKDFERCREYLNLGVAIQRDAKNAAPEPFVGADNSVLNNFEKGLETLNFYMNQLQDDAEAVKTSTSVEAALAGGLRAARLEQQTRELIRESASYVESSLAVSADLTSSSRELFEEAVKSAHNDAIIGCVGLLLISKDLRNTLEKSQENVYASGLQHVNAEMGKLLIEKAHALEAEAKQRVQSFSQAFLQLRKTKAVDAAMSLLKRANASTLLQLHQENTAELLSLGAHLLVFVENDIRATVDRVNHMGLTGHRLFGAAKLKYKEAERKFNAAREVAAKASTFLEAAEAAAELRNHALAMQALLFSFKKDEGSI